MTAVDQALIDAFTSFGNSVDRIATFRTVRQSFLARLPREVCASTDEDDLIWQLFQLRKKGRLPKHHSPRQTA